MEAHESSCSCATLRLCSLAARRSPGAEPMDLNFDV
jgi:hypothetical protein